MILYHGSNLEIKQPSLKYSRSSLDFGSGFYTTTDLQQAEKWANRVVYIRKNGKPTVSVFETDDVLWDKLSIKQFEKADKDWLQTVVAYRKLQKPNHQYDVIAGPIANDRTVDVINQYIAGAYPEHIALELLLPMKFQDQWALKSEKALAAIKWKETINL